MINWLRSAVRRIVHGRLADAVVAILTLGYVRRWRTHPTWRPRGAQSGQRCILVIDDRIPFPWLGAGFPRSAELLRQLVAGGWHVTFLPTMHLAEDSAVILEHFPAEIDFIHNPADRTFASFLEEMTGAFDVVIISRPYNMQMFRDACDYVPRFLRNIHVVYDAEAFITEREAIRRKVKGIPWTDQEYRTALTEELKGIKGVDLIFTVNEHEKSLISPHTRARVQVLSHSAAAHPQPARPDCRKNLLFVGGATLTSDLSPNTDSLVWFIRDVLPILVPLLGDDLILQVAGRIESEEVAALAGPNVRLLGMVPDLTELYGQSRLFIAPTRFAAGIPLKVLEASAQGLPVVATPLIARQLGRTRGVDILVGETATEFADACRSLYTDDMAWISVRNAALTAVQRECDPGMFSTALLSALAALDPRRATPQ